MPKYVPSYLLPLWGVTNEIGKPNKPNLTACFSSVFGGGGGTTGFQYFYLVNRFIPSVISDQICDWYIDSVIKKVLPKRMHGHVTFSKEVPPEIYTWGKELSSAKAYSGNVWGTFGKPEIDQVHSIVYIDMTKVTAEDMYALLCLCRDTSELSSYLRLAYDKYMTGQTLDPVKLFVAEAITGKQHQAGHSLLGWNSVLKSNWPTWWRDYDLGKVWENLKTSGKPYSVWEAKVSVNSQFAGTTEYLDYMSQGKLVGRLRYEEVWSVIASTNNQSAKAA